MRKPRTFEVLKRGGPALAGGIVALLLAYAALAGVHHPLREWGSATFSAWWPFMIAPWFIALIAMLLCLYVGALIYCGTGSPSAPKQDGGTAFHDSKIIIGDHGHIGDLYPQAAPKFSEETWVSNLPPFPPYNGNQTLDLGGLATLRLGAPYSETSVRMDFDVTPIRLDPIDKPSVEAVGVWMKSAKQFFDFDTDGNKRHSIDVGGKTFMVSLREIDSTPVAGVSLARRYKFSVVEM